MLFRSVIIWYRVITNSKLRCFYGLKSVYIIRVGVDKQPAYQSVFDVGRRPGNYMWSRARRSITELATGCGSRCQRHNSSVNGDDDDVT